MNRIHVEKELEDIIPQFMEHRNKDIQILNQAFKEKDLKKIQTIGHRLAGSAPGYGFFELGSIGEKLEIAAKESQFEQIQLLITQYEEHIKTVIIEYI